MSNSPRLAAIDPRHLVRDQQRLYDEILGGPRASGPQVFSLTDDDGCLLGPFNAMLLRPPIGLPLQTLGSALRFESGFTPRERELAILVVAGHWGSAFESTSHTAVALSVGLSESEVAGALAGDASAVEDAREAAIVTIVGDLARTWTLDDDGWERAVAAVGEAALFELTTLVGYYSLLALQLRVFSDES